ncbi:MAG TPA: aminomethyl-transferring glycine dehydrogenase subunit GcvPA [Rhodospirillales bacterium]|nr:aminomethyl-transferring glycine dehydrogenase subunit GcvPA [Rhodospirillales bacterium]
MRYLPLTPDDRRQMLAAIGVESIEALFCDVPADSLLARPVDLPMHADEMAVERTFRAYAAENVSPSSVPSFLGAGAYRHHIPAAVDHLIQRGEFLTAYTPYQPEIAQGTLQYLYEFQTQVALITGMEVANASLYDGATACAEAMAMACRLSKRRRVLLSGGLHPHWRATAETYARFLAIDAVALPPSWAGDERPEQRLDADTACVVVQNPDIFGRVHDYRGLAEACRTQGVLLVVAVSEVVSLGALASPGEIGADIFVGEGQSLGNAASFGGPTVGLLAARERFVRQMPGRLVGETVDQDGRRGFVLTLSTREQHIRREKATSNICTNSGLCALAFTIHLTMLGEAGFTRLAAVNHARAAALADRLASVPNIAVLNETFFNEFTVRLPLPAEEVVEALAGRGVLGGVPVSRLLPAWPEARPLLLVAATEMNSDADIEALATALTEVLQ